jgi:hypothetical protein
LDLDVPEGEFLRVLRGSGSMVEVELPDAVAGFLRGFDRGIYPDLIEQP